MKPPSTALLHVFSPWRQHVTPWTARGCLAASTLATAKQQQMKNKEAMQRSRDARRRQQSQRDPRIKLIRYHLQHPITPRPLRFSRTRFLRHWTIHRAWQLHQRRLRQSRELELERQYNSMRSACEALRLIDNHGLTAEDRMRLGEPPEEGKEMGRLYRIAMLKRGVWDGVPIEYARIQTDTPSREGWNHAWTR